MDTLLDIGVGILRLIPLILVFYIPALMGVAIWSERGEGYRLKAILWFAVGFGTIVFLHVLFSGASGFEAAAILGLSLAQILAALALATLTVYKLAD
ncbi:MAG TPA: hypothetical protein VHM69_03000 [Rubrobacter sp.]|nr:hypothetical protein [Rubrobacter sp.]